MPDLFLPVFYGSYRRDRAGIRLAKRALADIEAKGHRTELVDAREIDLPMLDRMYKEYSKGEAPENMERVADILRRADGFVFVTGEYNWGMQPGLKNLTDHFLEEWFWRPAAIFSYSAGRLAGARASFAMHPTLAEMGMVVVPRTVSVPQIGATLDEDGHPQGEAGEHVASDIDMTLDVLAWWAQAAADMRRATPHPA